MKSPLENLLSLKRWEEDEAKNLFATAKRALELEEGRLSELEGNFRVLREKMRLSGEKAVTIDEIRKMNGQMEYLFGLLQRQKESVASSSKRLDEANKILSEAAKQRKTYETVDERHKDAERQKQRKKEQKGIDEHAVMRFKKGHAE